MSAACATFENVMQAGFVTAIVLLCIAMVLFMISLLRDFK